MTRTRMRSITATMQVLAAARGDSQPVPGLTFDVLIAADRTDRPTVRRPALAAGWARHLHPGASAASARG